MTLSSAFNIINTSFNVFAAQSATIANNISNANTTGYSEQIVNLSASPYGGVSIDSTTRVANAALAAQLNTAASDSAMQSAISNGLSTLAQTVDDSSSATTSTGSLENGNSPYAMIANLNSAMAEYEADPSSLSTAQSAVSAASSLAQSLNAGATAVTQVRSQADSQIGDDVASVNSLLTQFQSVNSAIVSGLSGGDNVATLQDTRDSLVSQLSQQLGVTTSLNTNGSMSVFTDSGVTLFQNVASQVTFKASGTLGPNQTGSQVLVNGVPITGASSNMAIHSGAIAGLVQLRDTVAPQYQSQLDQIAGNLMTAFQETDQSTTTPGLPAQLGLFTFAGASSVPTSANWTGLASEISVNASVDPTQGGNATLLRDGGISDTANSDFTYNTSGDAGYTDRLEQLMAALQTPATFAASAGLGASASLSDYSNASVSWLQNANQQASSNATYQASLQSTASSALNNATGVNLDTELTHMLTIESSYTASAKLVTTVNSMFQAILTAV